MKNNTIPFCSDYDDSDFSVTIGNTTYLVSTHFNENSNQSVLSQFKRFIETKKTK